MEYITSVAGFFILSFVILTVSIISRSEKTEPNYAIGIRTKATLKNKDSWDLAHKKFFMYGLASGIVSASFAIIILVLLVLDEFKNTISLFSLVGYITVLSILIYGAVIANSEAKKLGN